MHALPEALVECLKNRQAVLVAGLGCGSLAQLPGWGALGELLVEGVPDPDEQEAIRALLRQGQLAPAFSLLREIVPENALAEVLGKAYPLTTPVPEAIQAIASAPFRGYLASGFDGLWAGALANRPELANRMVFADNTSTLDSARGPFLIQLLGRSDVPTSILLSPSEWSSKVVATGAAKYLETLHRKWSFVFIGFGPSDPDLALLAGRLLGNHPGHVPHFFVAPGLSSLDAKRVKSQFGLYPVPVEGDLATTIALIAEVANEVPETPASDDVEAWMQRLTADPDSTEAAAAVAQGLSTLRDRHEWDRLVGLLIERTEVWPDPVLQSADLREAGLILDQELHAADRAYPVLMTALRLRPQQAELLADARRIAVNAGQEAEFLREMRAIEQEASRADNSHTIALGIGRLYADHPERHDEAVSAFRKVLDRDPTNAEAHTALETIFQRTDQLTDLRALYEAALARGEASPEVAGKLEGLYERLELTGPLITSLEKRLAQSPDDGTAFDKLEGLYLKTQQWGPLGALYERLLDNSPDDAEVLAKLDEFYRRSEQWKQLADLLERRARAAGTDPAAALSARNERAGILIDKCKDYEAGLAAAKAILPDDAHLAEAIFTRILEAEEHHPGALAALADRALAKGDFLRAAKFAEDGAEHTRGPLEKGRLLALAGDMLLTHGHDEDKAILLLARALEADPEQLLAAAKLAPLREKQRDWTALAPLLDLLVRKTSDEDRALKVDRLSRSAACAHALGKLDKAAALLSDATILDDTSPVVARHLADLHLERKAFDLARAAYERASGLLGPTASAAEKAEVRERLALCLQALGDQDGALRALDEALALTPGNRALIETLIPLRTARGDWKEVIALKRTLLPLVADADKPLVLDDIGDLFQEKLSDWPAAMGAYREALALEPNHRQTLYRTLDYHTTEKQWEKALDTLTKVAALEADPVMRAKCHYAAAAIYRDELKKPDQAIARFGQVLDDQPQFTKALDALEKILGERGDQPALGEMYRKQLDRLPADAPVETKLRLWDGRVAVALKTKDREGAIAALETATTLAPDELSRQEQLAKLYFELGPTAADKAIAQHQKLLSKKPDRLDSYKALAALYFQQGQHDRMWCIAGAMTYLGKADPPLQAMYETFRPTQTPAKAGKLNDELWRKIQHPKENPFLSSLFAVLSQAIANDSAKPHKSQDLDRTNRLDLAGDAWKHTPALRYVAGAIDAPMPDLFIKKDAAGTLSLANFKQGGVLTPAIVAGLAFEQLATQSEVVFDLAKRMILLRPDRFPRFVLGSAAALEIAARAGLRLGGAEVSSGRYGSEIDTYAKKLDPVLSTPARAELKVLAQRFPDECGDAFDINAWLIAADLTASRAALAIAGDIMAAAAVLALEPANQSPLPLPDRMHDLVAYFISDDHFAVRSALGLQVNITPASSKDGHKRRTSHTQIKLPS